MNREIHAPTQKSANPVTAIDLRTGRPVAGAPGAAGCPAAGLPCLLLTSAPRSEKPFVKAVEKPLGSRTAIARKADTLRRNLQDLIERVGIERMGFTTLTFPWITRSRKRAEKKFHSFETHVLSLLLDEYIVVPERQENGSIHYHIAAAFPADIRSGFDFAACSAANLVKKHGYRGRGKWAAGAKQEHDALEAKYFASANTNLKRIWRVIREANDPVRAKQKGRKPYGFGRCQTLPVLSNADGIAFYIGTYITSQTERRAPEDKGMRSVRYSLKIRRYHQSFQFAAGGNAKWRAGCKVLGKLLLIHDEASAKRVGKKLVYHYPPDHVRSRFGARWPHRLAPWIFICYDHLPECEAFALTLAPDMAWRDRLLAVRQFLVQLKEGA
jgi:hypothetical protein